MLSKTLKVFLVLVYAALFAGFYFDNPVKLYFTAKIHLLKRDTCNPIRGDGGVERIELDGRLYPSVLPNYRNNSINFTCLNSVNENSSKLILFWNPMWGSWDYHYGQGLHEPFKKFRCPVWNCETTSDRARVSKADAVLVHINEFQNQYSPTSIFSQEVPKDRPPNQRWIYMSFESPATNRLDYRHFFKGVFNLSATYSLNSDFSSIYYGDMKFKWSRESSGYYDRFDVHESKTDPKKLAAAFISNCVIEPSGRNVYIKLVAEKINVDVFGDCGLKKCPTGPIDCREHIAKEYKFFFAFENSLCDEYATEKFFRTINFDIIPVVLGNGSYSKFIPKSGYIDVRDFSSPSELADYLVYVGGNKTAYNEYFAWKNFIVRDDPESYRESHFHARLESIENFMCELCTHLQLETHFGIKRSILDVEALFSKQNKCY